MNINYINEGVISTAVMRRNGRHTHVCVCAKTEREEDGCCVVIKPSL